MRVYHVIAILILLTMNVVYSIDSISDTLEDEEKGTYNLEGEDYEVYAVVISFPYIKISINGEVTPTLRSGDIYPIMNTTKIKIDDIQEWSCGDVMCNSFNFTLYLISRCGNNACEPEEDCSSCLPDCGCNMGYECQNGQCVEQVICGDGKCSTDETCVKDSCCNGRSIDFNTDDNNCGTCNQVCSSNNQTCVLRICTLLDEYCGDKVCKNSENCGDCPQDCVCPNTQRCENYICTNYCGNSICDIGEEEVCNIDCKWCGDNSCGANESFPNCPADCSQSVVCGDGICSSNEDCCKDCGCQTGFQCVAGNCISDNQCNDNSDCDDGNPCTQDICTGIPMVCSYQEEDCINLSRQLINSSINTSINPILPDSQNNNTSVTISTDMSVVARIINWIKGLFGHG